MRPQNAVARDRLDALLRRTAPCNAISLANTLDVSVPTIHRMIKERGEQIIRQGATKNTKYALRRSLRGLSNPIPIYCVGSDGHGKSIGNLDLIAPSGALMNMHAIGWPDTRDNHGWCLGLPYPLYDMSPQGFIGRNFARQITADLGVPDNPNDWSDDDIIYALSLKGADCSGNLIIGDAAYRVWLKSRTLSPNLLEQDKLPDQYNKLANIATSCGMVGSSGGGEFPKFTASRILSGAKTSHVIVKFSGADESSTVQRWADLLICEHLALTILTEHTNLPSASTRIIRGHGRTFLEVERFDRVGDFGRRSIVSLSALDGAFVGSGNSPWPELVRKLADLTILPIGLIERTLVLWWFGKLIANSDMHLGNLSFQFEAIPNSKPTLELTPSYDMLPMFYAPLSGGEIPNRDFTPTPPLPRDQAAWAIAFKAALEFWRVASMDNRISKPFRNICEQNYTKLVHIGNHFIPNPFE